MRVVPPNANAYLLASAHQERVFDREEHWEPTVHAWGVAIGMSTIKDILVELCCEEACKPVDLRLLFSNSEGLFVVHLQALVFSLGQIFHVLSVRVRQMPECKDFLRLRSTRVARTEYFDYIGELERVKLLRDRHSSRNSLLHIEVDLSP